MVRSSFAFAYDLRFHLALLVESTTWMEIISIVKVVHLGLQNPTTWTVPGNIFT